jgi:hypothetical protein
MVRPNWKRSQSRVDKEARPPGTRLHSARLLTLDLRQHNSCVYCSTLSHRLGKTRESTESQLARSSDADLWFAHHELLLLSTHRICHRRRPRQQQDATCDRDAPPTSPPPSHASGHGVACDRNSPYIVPAKSPFSWVAVRCARIEFDKLGPWLIWNL